MSIGVIARIESLFTSRGFTRTEMVYSDFSLVDYGQGKTIQERNKLKNVCFCVIYR